MSTFWRIAFGIVACAAVAGGVLVARSCRGPGGSAAGVGFEEELAVPDRLPREPRSVRLSLVEAGSGGPGASSGGVISDPSSVSDDASSGPDSPDPSPPGRSGDAAVVWHLRAGDLAAVLDQPRRDWSEEAAYARDVLGRDDLAGDLALSEALGDLFFVDRPPLEEGRLRRLLSTFRRFDDEYVALRGAGAAPADFDPLLDRVADWVEGLGAPADARRVVLASTTIGAKSRVFSDVGAWVQSVATSGLLPRAFALREVDPDRARRYIRAALTLETVFSLHSFGPGLPHYAPPRSLVESGEWPQSDQMWMPHEKGATPGDLDWGVAEVARIAFPEDAGRAAELEDHLRLRLVVGAAASGLINSRTWFILDVGDQFIREQHGMSNRLVLGSRNTMILSDADRDSLAKAFRETWRALPADVPAYVLDVIVQLARVRALAIDYDDVETVTVCDRLLREAAAGVTSETTRRWLDEAGGADVVAHYNIQIPENRHP